MDRARSDARKRDRNRSFFLSVLILLGVIFDACANSNVDYPIVYVRAPRYGENGFTKWPEVFNPVQMEPGADLNVALPRWPRRSLVRGRQRCGG